MDINGKVALITGGGTGLGREVALQLAREGMRLALNYSRSKDEADQTVADCQKLGAVAQAFQADVSTLDGIRGLIAAVDASFGRLDLLIGNAGTTRFIKFADWETITEDDWDAIQNLNLKGSFFLAQAAVLLMRRNGGGQIIYTSSVAGRRPIGSSIPYCVSKAGLIHLTRCLAIALAPDITVNSVAPGLLLTRWGGKFEDEQIKAVVNMSPLKRVTDIPDTAAIFVSLAKNGSITGQTIEVDAGVGL